MASNSYGTYQSTIRDDMDAHDACPPALCYALNYAVGSFASVAILQLLKRGTPLHAIIRIMQASDRQETRKAYGPGHPEA